MKTRILAQATLALVLLSGCWFDSGDGSSLLLNAAEAARMVPVSASTNPQAYVAYTQTLPTTESTGEPLSLNLIAVAPTSESDDPVALN